MLSLYGNDYRRFYRNALALTTVWAFVIGFEFGVHLWITVLSPHPSGSFQQGLWVYGIQLLECVVFYLLSRLTFNFYRKRHINSITGKD